jgi:hypothetical protein
MRMLTQALVSASDRIIPSSSDQVLKVIYPASYEVARQETCELALAFIWGGAVIVAMIFMLLLSIGGNAIGRHAGDAGFLIGLFLTWGSLIGLALHAARFLMAGAARSSIERAYARGAGEKSSKNAALGHEVHEERPRAILALTRSSDWDLVIQGILGVVLTILTR